MMRDIGIAALINTFQVGIIHTPYYNDVEEGQFYSFVMPLPAIDSLATVDQANQEYMTQH